MYVLITYSALHFPHSKGMPHCGMEKDQDGGRESRQGEREKDLGVRKIKKSAHRTGTPSCPPTQYPRVPPTLFNFTCVSSSKNSPLPKISNFLDEAFFVRSCLSWTTWGLGQSSILAKYIHTLNYFYPLDVMSCTGIKLMRGIYKLFQKFKSLYLYFEIRKSCFLNSNIFKSANC